jgi:hypothetical protein
MGWLKWYGGGVPTHRVSLGIWTSHPARHREGYESDGGSMTPAVGPGELEDK